MFLTREHIMFLPLLVPLFAALFALVPACFCCGRKWQRTCGVASIWCQLASGIIALLMVAVVAYPGHQLALDTCSSAGNALDSFVVRSSEHICHQVGGVTVGYNASTLQERGDFGAVGGGENGTEFSTRGLCEVQLNFSDFSLQSFSHLREDHRIVLDIPGLYRSFAGYTGAVCSDPFLQAVDTEVDKTPLLPAGLGVNMTLARARDPVILPGGGLLFASYNSSAAVGFLIDNPADAFVRAVSQLKQSLHRYPVINTRQLLDNHHGQLLHPRPTVSSAVELAAQLTGADLAMLAEALAATVPCQSINDIAGDMKGAVCCDVVSTVHTYLWCWVLLALLMCTFGFYGAFKGIKRFVGEVDSRDRQWLIAGFWRSARVLHGPYAASAVNAYLNRVVRRREYERLHKSKTKGKGEGGKRHWWSRKPKDPVVDDAISEPEAGEDVEAGALARDVQETDFVADDGAVAEDVSQGRSPARSLGGASPAQYRVREDACIGWPHLI